jgi:pimeloyl-ACP methyl ester carboxylesterase
MKTSLLFRAVALAGALWLGALPVQAAADADKTVVLVHGAFADGSCWSDVIRLLQARGVNVVSVQNPLVSLAGDVAATNRVLDQQKSPVVLVAHSWGGVVVTEAGVHPRVSALVYAAAFAPDIGNSVYGLLQAYPVPPWLGGIDEDGGGYQTLNREAFLTWFAPDLPTRQAQGLFAVQGPTFKGTLFETTTAAAWRSKPAWYVVAENDQIIPPDLQRDMAGRISARTSTVPAGHLVMLSHPARVVQAILAALRAP